MHTASLDETCFSIRTAKNDAECTRTASSHGEAEISNKGKNCAWRKVTRYLMAIVFFEFLLNMY